MSDAIQQAIEALRMTKYCIPAYGFHAEKVTIDEAIAGLQALQHIPQPVVDVNQQLLNDIINMMIAVKGAIRLGCYGEAYEYLNAAIAAAQGRNNEPISNLLG